MEKEISLVESLTGLDFVITHLDGRKIRIKNGPGEVIKHDAVKTVEHLGMPLSKKVYMFGNLFIHFKVKFPTHVDAKSILLIKEALSEKPTSAGAGAATTTPTSKNKKKRKKSNAAATANAANAAAEESKQQQ